MSEEDTPPKIMKIGPPKKGKWRVAEHKHEPEDVDEWVVTPSNRRQGQGRRAAAGRSTRTSSGRARDAEDDELEGFKEAESDNKLNDERRDEEEEAEESEPEDDLARLVNNPRALLEKLNAEDAQWAEDDAEDADAIEGLMSDDIPQTQSHRRRSSSSQPMSSHDQQRMPTASSSSSSKKRRTEGLSDGEDSSSKQSPPPSKKTKPTSTTPTHNMTANCKGKAKETVSHKHDEQQKQEQREQQRREQRELQKREERRKERECQLCELKIERRRLEQEDDEEQVRPERQSQSDKKRASKEKEKERKQEQGQSREREQVKHGLKSASGTEKVNGSARKKCSKPDEDIAWVDERDNEPSSSKCAPKRKREDEANGEGSELSEVEINGELDCTEDNITAVARKEGRIRLTDQHGPIQRVCAVAIKGLLTNICIKNAFPDGPEKSGDFAMSALITAAKSLKYNNITKKLRTDEDYGRKLASIPTQRVSNLRGKAKKAADPLVSTVFNLEDGNIDKVRWLHDGLRYIYPHNYENNTVDGEKAYSQPIFYQVLRNAFFNKPHSFGFAIMDRFELSHPEKPDEKEVPLALLALAATAVFASIEDHRTSRSEVGDFKSDLFLNAYRSNMDVLSEIKSDNISAYHRLMHDLYCKLTGMSATSVRKGARSFLNTKGMAQ